MDKNKFVVFLICLITPMLYQRVKFLFFHKSFHKIALRKRSGLQIHHGHYGILIVFAATLIFLFAGKNNVVLVGTFGFGWGLVLDEIIPSLLMPGKDRHLELRIYGLSEVRTYWLFFLVIMLVAILYMFFGA